MDAITAIPASRIAEIQKDAKSAMSAEKTLRKAYANIFKSLYKFGNDFGEAPVKAELATKGITVRSDAQHKHWVGVCKLAFGADEGYAQQVNKYSNVLAYAKAKKVKPEEVDGWLGDGTLTGKIQAARLHFGRASGGTGNSSNTQLTSAIVKIEETWEPLLEAGMPTVVDLGQVAEAGIKLKEGKVEILCEMDAEGNLKPIGIVQASDNKLYDLIKPRALRQAASKEHTLEHLKELFKFFDIVPMGAKKPRCVVVKCTPEEWGVYAANPVMVASAIAIAKFKHQHEELPDGQYQLGVDEQKALGVLLSQFGTMNWDIRKEGNECAIEIKDGDRSSVQERINAITNARQGKNPAYKHTWPPAVDAKTQTLVLEDGTDRELSRPHRTVQFGVDDNGNTETVVFPMPFELRKTIKSEWENTIKGQLTKPQVRLRFGTNGVSFMRPAGTNTLARINYNINAPTGFQKWFETDGRVLIKSLDCMNAAIGEGDCTFAFSDTILRFQAIQNDAEYTIYLPETGAQNVYKTNELGMGKVLL